MSIGAQGGKRKRGEAGEAEEVQRAALRAQNAKERPTREAAEAAANTIKQNVAAVQEEVRQMEVSAGQRLQRAASEAQDTMTIYAALRQKIAQA